MRASRIAKLVAAAAGIWLCGLAILGLVYGGKRGQDIATRVGEALRAESTLGDSDLALVRGALVLEALRAVRDDEVGRLTLEIRELRCELLPLGGALLDGECRELRLSGLGFELSSFELLRVKRPRREPIRAGAVVIEDAVLVVPAKLGRVEVTVTEARAGASTFRTPLSWVLSLESLTARVTLPFGTAEVRYLHNTLVVSGSLFPSQPIVMPLVLPAAQPDDDGQAELQRLVAWGTPIVARIVKEYVRQAIGR
jgi:hypothetical protein